MHSEISDEIELQTDLIENYFLPSTGEIIQIDATTSVTINRDLQKTHITSIIKKKLHVNCCKDSSIWSI
jgi:hypothetical protein